MMGARTRPSPTLQIISFLRPRCSPFRMNRPDDVAMGIRSRRFYVLWRDSVRQEVPILIP
jgi:hypothetical protein